MEDQMATFLSIVAGLGLAAACGFRVFVPLLTVSLASRAELLTLSDGFAWIGSTPALICFGIATALEIAAYYLPVVDNFLDTVATPASVIAGAMLSAAVMVDVDPWLRWTLAIVAGGGLAATVQIPTVGARGTSTATTAGIGNPLVSTGELALASTFSVAAVFWPLLIPVFLLGGVFLAAYVVRRRQARRAA